MKSKFIFLSFMILMAFSSRAQEEKNFLEVKSIDMGMCVSQKKLFPNGIIRTGYEYRILKNYIRRDIRESCKNFELPKLDMDKYDLIFSYINSNGCSLPELTPELYYNSKGELIHNLKIKGNSNCRKIIHIYSWTLTLNLPINEKITYQHEFVVNY